MMHDVIEAQLVDGYRIRLRFDDGVEGIVDVEKIVTFTGVFAALRDPSEFSKLALNTELGTITWPCGADLDPLVLHAAVAGEKIQLSGLRLSISRQ
jgi:hypothetical protein